MNRHAERLHADEEGHRGAPSSGVPGKRAVEQGERGRLGPDLPALSHFSYVLLFATLWTLASQAPLFMGFSRQEY